MADEIDFVLGKHCSKVETTDGMIRLVNELDERCMVKMPHSRPIKSSDLKSVTAKNQNAI